MQRSKTITLGSKSVTIKEIPVSKVLNLFRGSANLCDRPLPGVLSEIQGLLPLALDTTLDDLLKEDLFYDDFTQIYDAFKETNPAFFETARALKLDSVLAALFKTLTGELSVRLLSSLSTDTTLLSTGTDTASSLT